MSIAIPTGAAIRAFFTSKKFLIPAAIIALLLAIGGGTYFYLNHQKDEAVKTAVQGANSNATIQTYQTEEKVRSRTDEIDSKMNAKALQTAKDHQYVRNRIDNAPVEQKTAPVPPLIIDTLNELDRLRSVREGTAEGSIPDAEVPVG